MREALDLTKAAVAAFSRLEEVAPAIDAAASAMIACLKGGGKIFFCGNGGSAADSIHLAAEFLGRFKLERDPLPAVALVDNLSAITAIANDYDYKDTFARQFRGLGSKGDVLTGISTSGKSLNVIEAFRAAKEIGATTIALTGAKESPLSEMADIAIMAPSAETPRIQEMHIAVGHIICEIAEKRLAREK
ncbi:MAG: SIS domain-containing protein [Desulfovibrio sp.]|nr:SIS domain-containing protein [Desulfovibrio sp.]